MAKCHIKKGFTMIEATIVLAVTGLMLVGILGAINVRVAAQRYTDTVQHVEDFLRSVYSEVINVENGRDDIAFNQSFCSGPFQVETLKNNNSAKIIDSGEGTHAGRSKCSIYGKLVTFGENEETKARVYTVVGQLRSSEAEGGVSSIFDALKVVGADAYAFDYGADSTQCIVSTAGTSSTFTPLWDARLEATGGSDLLKTAYMIIRSPISGAVHTYRLKPGNTVNIAKELEAGAFSCGGNANSLITKSSTIQGINYHLNRNDFEVGDVDICINSPDLYAAGSSRRDLRIKADGRNTSAVEFVETDSEDNRCK